MEVDEENVFPGPLAMARAGFDFRLVEPVFFERHQDVEQGARAVLNRKHDRCFVAAGPLRLGGADYEKAREVVGGVLDA